MESSQMESAIRAMGKAAGAGDVGFADLSVLPAGQRRGFPSAVSVVVPLSLGILREIQNRPTITYFAHYRAVNRLIDALTLKISLYLESEGCGAFAVPASQSDPGQPGQYASAFPHKTAATLSGMGFVGKNALFIHRDFGPAVRLGTVLTTADFTAAAALMPSRCGDCTICRDRCPAQAIEGAQWEPGIARGNLVDARVCSTYMKREFQAIGRGSVCGLCMVSCPYTRRRIRQMGLDHGRITDETL
jgi:epoxyqueuosine reductase